MTQTLTNDNVERLDIHNSDVPMVCRSCEARHKGICGALSPDQLVHLNSYTTRSLKPSGTELVSNYVENDTYANLLRGVIKLSMTMSDGRHQIVGLQFPPDFVGRVFEKDSKVTAEAASEVHVCSFPRHIIDKFIDDTPELEHRLHKQSIQELDEARDWLLTLGRKTAQEKLVRFLLLIGENIDPETESHAKNCAAFDLPLTRADIADFLGLTIETVSRQLTKLRKAGLIEIESNRHIVIPDLDKIRQLGGGET